MKLKFVVISKKNEGNLEYKDNSFSQINISWYDMEFNEFSDFVGVNNEYIIPTQNKKDSEMGIIDLNETDLENVEMIEKNNILKIVLMSGHFGGFDRKKSKKNIEIVVNIIGKKNCPLNIIKL